MEVLKCEVCGLVTLRFQCVLAAYAKAKEQLCCPKCSGAVHPALDHRWIKPEIPANVAD